MFYLRFDKVSGVFDNLVFSVVGIMINVYVIVINSIMRVYIICTVWMFHNKSTSLVYYFVYYLF